jgi:hypothetical protein
VALDQPASSAAAWAISDATGVRPEYLYGPLFQESNGFQTNIQNYQGAANYGLNQISGAWLTANGIDLQTYLSWTASQQLYGVVLPFLQQQVRTYGKIIRSGTRMYQANMLPGSLKLLSPPQQGLGTLYFVARAWNDKITCSPSRYYAGNAGLDTDKSGCITVADLGAQVTKLVTQPAVQAAIAAAYVLRPGEKQQNPVYGTDSFGALSKTQTALAVGAILGGAGLAAWALAKGPG